ncbi:hypothetical protein CDL12_06576 [Handroanthus impetiginosus]|uniref:Uncharacterized protein n=1 Tax=Handroanthus impetiginosus TaxID=429701 RepID=A0A2G9HT83_9LAMI|nr:hypothetical protein CDL12_06576 [Handroanthus impetiginosus]
MRIVRGMQKSICEDQSLVGWKNESLTCGTGITAPKARTRDKLKRAASYL